MKLIIDNREKLKSLFTKTLNIEYKNLDIGDYILEKDENTSLIIERKTIEDYAASIRDGRNREQKKRLKASYPNNRILYIVEGSLVNNNKSYKFNKVKPYTIISSIVNTMLRDNIFLVHTIDCKETIFFIENLYKKLEKQGLSFIKNTSHYSEDIVNTISKKKNKNIDKHTCNLMMLCNIPKVSIKTAERLLLNFSDIYTLIDELKKTNNDERISALQNIPSIDGKNRKIPKDVCINIINFLVT